MTIAKKPVPDKQTCAGIANLKIKGFYRLHRLFFKDFIGLKI